MPSRPANGGETKGLAYALTAIGVAIIAALAFGAIDRRAADTIPTATTLACVSGTAALRYEANVIKSVRTDRDGTTVILNDGTRVVLSPAIQCMIVTSRVSF